MIGQLAGDATPNIGGRCTKLVDGVLKDNAGLGMLVHMLFIPGNISSELVYPCLCPFLNHRFIYFS